MALDISILDSNGRPSEVVRLTVDEHWSLFGELDNKLTSAQRLSDYYSEVEFSAAEIPSLISDLEVIKTSKATVTEAALIDRLIDLALRARARHISIVALPD
ncbi:MAG TPA: hypothetical protein VGM54_03340 [Chthoniobacter sp.]|jgi:hypothetical protein